MKKPLITLCSSCDFYQHLMEVARELEKLRYEPLVPETAPLMEKNNDWDVSHYKTWFAKEDDYPKKARLMRAHFKEVARADAILVINDEKHGVKDYIGANVLMEMGLAFWLEKPIFILNGIPAESKFTEEIKGMLPVVLSGDLAGIAKALPVSNGTATS